MNWEQIKGNWRHLAGKATERWGKLTDDDWVAIEGQRDQLVGLLQQRYGLSREEAEGEVSAFERSYEQV